MPIRSPTTSFLALAFFALLIGCGGALAEAPSGRPCTLPGYSGVAECFWIDVPRDFSDPGGARLSLHVARVRAREARGHAAPLTLLAGGPGQAATDLGGWLDVAFRRVHARRDVLLVDQRGTGASRPLRCEAAAELGLGAVSSEALRAIGARCLAEQTDDPRWFSTEAVVRDLDRVRARLGYDRLALWGASFGTRTALRYLARFPDRVEAMVLDGVAPNTEPLFFRAPAYAQAAFEALLARCAEADGCDPAVFEARATRLLELEARTVQFVDPVVGEPRSVRIDGPTLRGYLRAALYRPARAGLLPVALERASKGDFGVLAALASETAGRTSDTMDLGATMSILCSEDVDRISAEEARGAGAGSLFADEYHRFWSALCTEWPRTRLPEDYAALVESSIPTLALSGGLDPVTPPAAAELGLRGLPNAHHLVARNAGHNVTPLGCAPRLVAEFLDDPASAPDGRCLDDIHLPHLVSSRGAVR